MSERRDVIKGVLGKTHTTKKDYFHMLKKLIGTIVELYTKSFIAQWFAKRRAAKLAKQAVTATGDVVTDVIEEARNRAADAMAGRGVYATYTAAEREAEFNTMFNRAIHLTQMQETLKHAQH